MRRISLATAVAVVLGVAAPAAAGPFGGFSQDRTRYLDGRDQVCAPIRVTTRTSRALPGCEQADGQRIAAMKFRRGVPQQGARADFEARSRGTDITVQTRRDQRPIVTWSTFDPIERITGVYASEDQALVAVEYEVRAGGRAQTRVVAFALSGAATAGAGGETAGPVDGTDGADGTDGTAPRAGEAPAPVEDARLGELLTRARRLDTRGRAAPAEAAYRQVLEVDPGHAEAHYGLARNLARQRKPAAAVDALRALASSGRADAVAWLVEARFDRAFRDMRGDAGFRAAVGLDRDPARPRSLYERLLGFSNVWEQAEVKCEQAEVRLDMDRRARTFRLAITTRCGGRPATTRLEGSFRLQEGADTVELVLPNPEGPDEAVPCRMDRCSGEDCLRCAIDRDLSFTLLPVRR